MFWKNGRFEYRPIYYFESYFNDDPFTPIAITYPLLNQVADLSNTTELQWEYWDSEKNVIMNEEGDIIFEEENPYGILPRRSN